MVNQDVKWDINIMWKCKIQTQTEKSSTNSTLLECIHRTSVTSVICK